MSPETLNQFFSRPTELRTFLQILSTLAQTLVLLSSRRPASCLQTVRLQKVHLYCALTQTALLQSRSRPASYNQHITDPSLQQGALVQTLLLLRASRPASHTLTLTDLPVRVRVTVRLSPTLLSPTDLLPTDLNLLSPPALIHLLCRKLPERTVFLVLSRKQTVIFRTGLRLNFLLRKESCRTSNSLLSMIYQPQRKRRTEKQSGVSGPLWVGRMYRA